MNRKSLQYIALATTLVLVGVCYYYLFNSKLVVADRSGLTDDITILYTSDVHCHVDENIGYAGLVAYKNQLKKDNKTNVVLVDCGDAIQGAYIGAISKGLYITEIMNKVGYEYCVLGNHEFDYGMKALKAVIEASKAKYLNCNITYQGYEDNALAKTVPYSISTYGKTKVAFIGVSAPGTITSSTPAHFQENDQFVYDFKARNNGAELYNQIQNTVNNCLRKGVHYVVLLAHLGSNSGYSPYSSVDVIANTRGIDAVIDGHSHSTIPYALHLNKIGERVLLTSCGEKLKNIGCLNISPKGIISSHITEVKEKDQEITAHINRIKSDYEANLKEVIGTSTHHLSAYDENNVRIIRNRETNLGDWVADALLASIEGDIALFNGGSIRADIPKGTITLGTFNSVNGFNNQVCKTKATGQEILDALEMGCRHTSNVTTHDGKRPVGENGGFLQVSGLEYTIDTSIPSSVVVDYNGMFVKVADKRRVKNVMVNENGFFKPINPNRVYTVVSTDYLIKLGGDGINLFAKNKLILDGSVSVTQAYIDYFKLLKGDLSEYALPHNRITIQ